MAIQRNGSRGGAGDASAPAGSRTLRPRPGRARGAGQSANSQSLLKAVTRRMNGANAGARASGSRLNSGHRTHSGRGAGVGSARINGQRVLIKARVVRIRAVGAKQAMMAHLAYVTRHGVGLDGQESVPFNTEGAIETPELNAFVDRAIHTRHQFRFIVSPEHGAALDLEAYTQELMGTMATDLGTRLDWMAVAHHDTDNPHIHITVNGVTDRGQDLVISRDYLSAGMRSRASDLATRELGLRTEQEIAHTQDREVVAERFTAIDRQLLRRAQESPTLEIDLRQVPDRGYADAVRRRNLQLGRLNTLERLGLAEETAPGMWRLDAGMAPRLQQLGRRGDIIKTMHAHARGIDAGESLIILGQDIPAATSVTGKVVGKGRVSELHDVQYVVIDGVDGRLYHATLPPRLVVHEPDTGLRREMDTAGAPCRVGDVVTLAPAVAHEKSTARAPNMTLTRHTVVSLEEQVKVRGPTWCDAVLTSDIPAQLVKTFPKSPFQRELQKRLQERTQTLTELGLATRAPNGIKLVGRLDDRLREVARRDAGQKLESKLGDYVGLEQGARFTGVVDHITGVAGQAHAVVRCGARFTLAPLTQSVEEARRYMGQNVDVELIARAPSAVTDLAQQRVRASARVRVLAMDLAQQRDLSLGL